MTPGLRALAISKLLLAADDYRVSPALRRSAERHARALKTLQRERLA